MAVARAPPRRLGDRRLRRRPHRPAAPPRPVRPGRVPLLRGPRALPARPRRGRPDRAAPRGRASSTTAATRPARRSATACSTCRPAAAGRSSAPASAAGRSRSTTRPRRSTFAARAAVGRRRARQPGRTALAGPRAAWVVRPNVRHRHAVLVRRLHRGVPPVRDARAGPGGRGRRVRRHGELRPLRALVPRRPGQQAWVFLAAAGGRDDRPARHERHAAGAPLPPGCRRPGVHGLEDLYPGRVFLGAGSGEALNEVPLGLDWPSPRRAARAPRPGLEAITRLWDGETVTMDAGWFRLKEAKLYTPRGAPPGALRLRLRRAGRRDRREVRRRAVDARRPRAGPRDHRGLQGRPRAPRPRAGRDHPPVGLPPRPDEEQAVASPRKWKPTQLPEVYTDDIHDPAEMVASPTSR